MLKVNNILHFFFYYFRALDKNEYNHITATYYLLAERKLNLATSKKFKINKKYFYNISPISLQVCIHNKYIFFSEMNVPQVKIDKCVQNNVSEIDNTAPNKSAVLGTLHSDRPKVM